MIQADSERASVSLQEVSDLMDRFVRDRGWYDAGSTRPQTARNLAASLSIEAAELLECFQWTEQPDRDRLADEVADVLLYLVQFARIVDVDPIRVALEKLHRNADRTWPDSPARPAS